MNSMFMWECTCGYIEYDKQPPEDCPKCLRIGKFKKVPEELIEEREAKKVLSKDLYNEEYKSYEEDHED